MVDANSNDGAAVVVDMGEGSMTICSKHPYKNNRNNPGGICPFCLQEKLGKLVSSSLPIAVFPSSTNSASHSFRSESSFGAVGNATAARTTDGGREIRSSSSSKPRIPFLSYHRSKKDQTAASSNGSVMLTRSKSTTTPSRKFLDNGDKNLQKRWFWSSSFWYHPKRVSENKSSAKGSSRTTPSASFSQRSRGKDGVVSVSSTRRGIEGKIAEEEEEEDYNDSPGSDVTTATTTPLGRKVSRSRSVGCGSRSFSGDFFERISTGLGDCTLRRVESQREGNNKAKVEDSYMKERVRCGGIFGGFMVPSSSSSSSSSSHWLPTTAVNSQIGNGKGRSWGWAFASPIRAFGKPSSGKERRNSNMNATPNLAAMPSLISAGSNRWTGQWGSK